MPKYLFLLLTFLSLKVASQERDFKDEILLNNPAVIIQATEAVNMMYNFKFELAEKRFNWLKQDYPDHPLPYFMMGLSIWWKIMPNIDNQAYDDVFEKYMDTAINKAELMGGKKAENAEKVFFLAGGHAFKARLYAERQAWRKASFEGKKALNYLEESRKYTDWSPEFLFGEGLYNYYAEWIKENYKFLRPILLFFPNGDKQLGMKQLEENSQQSFYTRTEGQYWLMRIYHYENDDEKAFQLGAYLNKTFPDNAYFHRYYARLAFTKGKFVITERESLEILKRLDNSMTGYEEISGRYASFFLGFIYRNRDGNLNKAKEYFEKCIKYSEVTEDEESGYYLHSIYNLAQMANSQGKEQEAVNYYNKLLGLTEKKSSLHKESLKYLKAHNAVDDGWWPF